MEYQIYALLSQILFVATYKLHLPLCIPLAVGALDWPLWLYDPVIINTDGTKIWPQSGLNGRYRFS